MQDLIFIPLKVPCPHCLERVQVSIEELQFKDELTCPKCEFNFMPDIDVEKLLILMKLAETSKFEAPNEEDLDKPTH